MGKSGRKKLTQQNSTASNVSGGGGATEAADETMLPAEVAAAGAAAEVAAAEHIPSDSDLERDPKRSKPAEGPPPDSSAGASLSAAASAAPATPLSYPEAPTDVAGLGNLMQELMRNMAALSTVVTTAVRSSDQVAASVAALDAKVGDQISGLDSKLDAYKQEVDAKFAALAASPAAPVASHLRAGRWQAPGPSTAAAASGTAPASYYAPAAGPAAHRPPPWTSSSPAAQPGLHEFGSKVFALGFPRRLPRTALMTFWDDVRGKLPGHFTAEAKFQGGHGKSFGVGFPTREAARLFVSAVRDFDLPGGFKWASPREGEGTSMISFRIERTVAEGNRGRALSKSWELVAPLVKACPAWKAGMKLITDSSRGTIAIATGRDMWDLVELRPAGDGYTVHTDDSNLLLFGVGPAIAEAIRTSLAKPIPTPTPATAAAAAVEEDSADGDM
jgi:hypothetical protein